ncbi:non-ribosomal peptide synthetase [Bailinhaonella thermotolerans]|nr:non-ribosomal peptide synthetase [Bailinhaonella thermotolerans]
MIEDAYPLAALQAGMLYHSELEEGTPTFHDVMTMTLRGRFDEAAMTAALAGAAARHPVLRTSFDLTGFSEPVQLVHDEVTIPLAVRDLSGRPDAAERLRDWREEEKRRGFDWAKAPLLRAFVHLLPGGEFALTLSFHHAILDGWSVAALTTELLRRYAGGYSPPPLGPAFRDLVAAEREITTSAEAAAFWRARVEDAPDARLPRLPAPPREPGEAARAVAVLSAPVGRETEEAARRLAREARVPLRTVLLAAHCRVMALMTGTPDVLTGTVVHGRPEDEAGGEVLGLFLNTVPLRVRADAPTWRELVLRVFRAETALMPYRMYPHFEIQKASGRAPLLDTLFDYRDFHVYDGLGEGPGPVVTGQEFFEQTDLPFTAAFGRAPSGLVLSLSYDSAQFTAGRMADLRDLYLRVLADLTADPDADPRPSGRYAGADLIERWNDTGRDLPGGTLAELVWERARRDPDATAIVWEGAATTYRDLARRAGAIAVRLRGLGAGPERPIGVCLDRGPDLPAALLGVLATGAPYLPLEPGHPAARTAAMLADAGAGLVVTTRDLAAGLPSGVRTMLLPDGAANGSADVVANGSAGGSADGSAGVGANDAADGSSGGATGRASGGDLDPGAGGLGDPVPAHPDSLAYVIFTSGSTGRPKGVGVSHRAIVNRLRWMADFYAPGDVVLHKTPYTFDVSVWELFGPLLTGAAMVVARPGGHLEPEYLADLVAATGVTTLHFVPSMLDAFLETPDLAARLATVRRVVCSGEALPAPLAARFAVRLPHAELHNLYGPTEAAVDVSAHRCEPGETVVPIGGPVPNTRLEVLDELLERVPQGVPGQLFIGGVQLARGYVNRPGLTAERFVPDPYGPPGSRLYATGDLARRLPDGEVEYLGRTDLQVKVRGMRVEPGEVEAALLALPGVRAAVVTARGDRLAAHVVSDTEDDWAGALRATLPDHMIPAAWVRLDALPLTANGKLDRAALPEPGIARKGYEPPRDAVEARLAAIWEEILGVVPVGRHDDFFALGGHSLLALRLALRVRRDLGRDLPVARVLTAPTVAGLAEELRRPDDLGAGSRVVPLNPGGDRTPLFLVHALGGQVFRYLPLARRLGEDQPVYAIAARGLAPGEEPHSTLDEMVEDYVAHVRAARPRGPYVLGGFCIGGDIAMEMARRLRAEGEDVPLVVLFYSDADEPVISSSLESDTALMMHALAGGPLEADFEALSRMEPDERLLAIIDAASAQDRLAPDTEDLEQARRFLRVFRANAHAVGRFRHPPYDGDVALFAPDGERPDLGWRAIVTGRLAIAPIPPARVTVLYEPLVADAATTIRKWIDHGI